MAKLSKAEAKAHDEAVRILAQDRLSDDDKAFVQQHWQESANHVNTSAGAFFTPPELADHAVLEMPTRGRVIDLCAGIGSLSLALQLRRGWWDGGQLELVCVELNPEYAAIGRKMVPEAQWIVGSIFDLPDLGHFDAAMSNPPFGNIKRDGDGGTYKGAKFEYHTIDVAAGLADYGMFIIPQMSAGFRYSGAPHYERAEETAYRQFAKQTGLHLDAGYGVDTTLWQDQWHGVSPKVEIVAVDLDEHVARQAAQPDPNALFDDLLAEGGAV